jgi:hypothetical protein
MTNMYTGMGADDMPTVPYQVPGGPGDNGPGGRGKGAWSGGKWAAALLAVCAAVGGGTFVVVQAATGSSSATAHTQAVGAPTGSVTGQAAVLRDVLTATGIRRLARLRRLGGMHGQYTFETRQGPRTLAFERGTITSVSGGDVVVRAADGTTWTWALTGTSVVRENGRKEPASALAQGEAVFAGGLVTNAARDARLIVIRKAEATGKTSGTA